MFRTKKPYIIVPKLIEQPTWGGDYIIKFKNWDDKLGLKNKKIGQSYELFGQSKLLLSITDSANSDFNPDIGFPYSDEIITENKYKESQDYIALQKLINQNPEQVLGKKVLDKIGKMGILIKFTQALGNSFQLHIKRNIDHSLWRPKAESWYYFENGYITYGIQSNCNLNDYKKTCIAIDHKMHELSQSINENKISLEEAKIESQKYIKDLNPWQFVNVHHVEKYCLLDLSPGGIHHSWEQDNQSKFGNVLYEIQEDVSDPVSTLRSFDQGKFKDNGEVRELHIDDYFTFLDANLNINNIHNAIFQQQGKHLLSTPYYSLDILEIKNKLTDSTGDSFCHLFVREGEIEVTSDEGHIKLDKGHSCFIPYNVNTYEIKSNTPLSVVLKTFVEV